MKILSKLMLLVLPVLAACGGSGSDDQVCTGGAALEKNCVPKSTNTLPEGIWNGATTTGLAAQTLVLENGQYFSVYTSSGNFVWMTEGIITAKDGAFNDPATVALSNSGALMAGVMNGSFIGKTSLSATTNINTTPITEPLIFNGNYNTVYDTPLTVADVLGNWTNPATVTTSASVTFAADGTLTGSQGACTFTGTVKPRATGKHVLDGSLLFTSSACSAGINVAMPIEATVINGQLTFVGVTPQRSSAFSLTATR
ncbi:hypothetical protein AWB65_01071 [Caballeronia humi]|jgi:hypothetical protein|uniref:Lipoprotein n=2 Tax=Caballeronia humi TaxID=326474 RepID=A0A158FMC6_9BURK|nr:hypothetical protein AWB65_01071 [Caballeronia humi]